MTIESAIKNLEAAKANGVKNIVLAYWDADSFEMEEGEEWAGLSDYMEEVMDWSGTHDDLSRIKDEVDCSPQN